jgi:hypothetical protein
MYNIGTPRKSPMKH